MPSCRKSLLQVGMKSLKKRSSALYGSPFQTDLLKISVRRLLIYTLTCVLMAQLYNRLLSFGFGHHHFILSTTVCEAYYL